MLQLGAWIVFATAALATSPRAASRPEMRTAPLPPAWTATSMATRHRGPHPEAIDPGNLPVKPGTDRDGLACLRKLRRLRIPFRRAKPTRGIRTPIIVTGKIRGLKLSPMWGKKPALMDCRFALSLYRIAPTVLRSGWNEFRYSSCYSYRNVAGTHHLSRHSFGLAVDVFELRGPGGLTANVHKDWIHAQGRPGNCVAGVSTRKARLLRGLICNLERQNVLYLVLTPDADYAHRDHFHISGLKPGESARPRHRYAGRLKGRTWIPRRAIRHANRRHRRRRRRRHHRARPRHHRARPRHHRARPRHHRARPRHHRARPRHHRARPRAGKR